MTTITVEQQDPMINSNDTASLVAYGVVIAIILILFVIAWWKIFKKAGLQGWKSIIPFYSQYCIYRISGMSGWWVLLPTAAAICYSLSIIPTESSNTLQVNPAFFAIACILGVAASILEVVQILKIDAAFKKGIVFKIFSIFFPNITYLILAFGKAKYNKKYLHD